jgi:hypothetical protein
MYICYLDESGTIETGSTGTHFVLLGLAIPDTSWKSKDLDVSKIKSRYGLSNAEIHTGWMLRTYPEQNKIPNFDSLDYPARIRAVESVRNMNLSRPRTNKAQRELTKNYRKTRAYIHLSQTERLEIIRNLADLIASWADSRIFADARDKRFSSAENSFEFAFEQIITRFNKFLVLAANTMGIIVQDHNETVCRRLTEKMREFHRRGTLWSQIGNIVETPLFVDSQLTSMVQIADLCAYSTRRFFENNEIDLFNRIYDRFDRTKGKLVGLRHYTGSQPCACRVCMDHQRQ